MSRGAWQRTIVNDQGDVIPGASVSVRNQSGDLIPLFDSYSGAGTLPNPFSSDLDGFAKFYAAPGFVNITADSGGSSQSWQRVLIPGDSSARATVGTVSQSAGVPTGAIIERGSNANGEYVKFADGTLQCWHEHDWGFSGHVNGVQEEAVWTFPHSFSAPPQAESVIKSRTPVSIATQETDQTFACAVRRNDTLTTSVNHYIRPMYDTSANRYILSGLTAIGRWY